MRTVVVTLAVFSFVVAGCEGSGDMSASSEPATATTAVTTTATATVAAPPVTHRQFIKQLDHICRVANRKVDRFNKRYAEVFASNDDAEIANTFERAERILAPSRAAMDKLEVPPEDERKFRRYLALTDRVDGLFRREIVALRQGDDSEYARLDNLVAHTRNQRTNVAVDIGLRACGS